MGLFGTKKQETPQGCCCGGKCTAQDMEQAQQKNAEGDSNTSIKVLGSGCAKCNALEAAVKAALAQLGRDAAVEHVTDFAQIAAYGVMTTPALVVNGKVVSFGKALKKDEAVALLQAALGQA